MRVSNYLDYTRQCEKELAKAFKAVAKHHVTEPDVHGMCLLMASWSLDHSENLEQLVVRFGDKDEKEPDRMDFSMFTWRAGSLGLLRDLHDLWLMVSEVKLCWIILLQCAKAMRDTKLKLACMQYGMQTKRQGEWLLSKIKQAASQVLTVPA